MAKKKVPKQYEIDSFEKLCNVINEKNFESLTIDLMKWLAFHVKMMRQLREKEPKATKGKSNWDLARVTFLWIDDGKHDFKKLVLKNQWTGEVKTVELKTK